MTAAMSLGIRTWLLDLRDEADETAPAADRFNPWSTRDGFQLGSPRTETRSVVVNGATSNVTLAGGAGGPRLADADAAESFGAYSEHRAGTGRLLVIADGVQTDIALPAYDATSTEDDSAGDAVRAPINGKVARVLVQEGDAVTKGDRIAVVEAMKMEHVLTAARDGTIAKVAVSEGQQVNQGALIASLAEA